MLLPAAEGPLPEMSLEIDNTGDTPVQSLGIGLRVSTREGGYTPDLILQRLDYPIRPGKQQIVVRFDRRLPKQQYIFVVFEKTPAVHIRTSRHRLTGVLAVFNSTNPAVSNYGRQEPPGDAGLESFEFWCPRRRPAGENLAITFGAALHRFEPAQVVNGFARPTDSPNAWIADPADERPVLTLRWPHQVRIRRIVLSFDTDFDHPMESVLMGHPERVMPFCIRHYRLTGENGHTLYVCRDNYRTRNNIVLEEPVLTRELHLQVEHPSAAIPAALFEIRCY
jgi:hypothetical protein